MSPCLVPQVANEVNSLQAVPVIVPPTVAGAEAVLSHISAADDKVGSIWVFWQAAGKSRLRHSLQSQVREI